MGGSIQINKELVKAYSVLLIFVFCACGKQFRGISVLPQKNISLFNGTDLSSFYTWLADSGYSDPDSVFSMVHSPDGTPAIRISGQHIGGLITKSQFRNYKLVAEYRWGTATWGTRKSKARDAGILLHCQGEDGNNMKSFASPWMRSIEYQMIEGGTGDLLLVSGFDRRSLQLIKPAIAVSVLPGSSKWNERAQTAYFPTIE